MTCQSLVLLPFLPYAICTDLQWQSWATSCIKAAGIQAGYMDSIENSVFAIIVSNMSYDLEYFCFNRGKKSEKRVFTYWQKLRNCCSSIFVKKGMSIFILLPQPEAHKNISEVCLWIYISISLAITMSISLSICKVYPFLIANSVLLSRCKTEECECQECTGVSGMVLIAWPMINLVFSPFH